MYLKILSFSAIFQIYSKHYIKHFENTRTYELQKAELEQTDNIKTS